MNSNVHGHSLATLSATLLKQAVKSGWLAGVLSTVVLMVRGRRDSSGAVAPLNAPSHWLFGREALRADRPSWRHTLSGLVIHHSSAMLWGILYDQLFCTQRKKRSKVELIAGAAGVTAVAALVDFKLVPERLTPGFEHRLKRDSLLLTYGAFAAGLAITGLLASRRS